jgi:hypothetical protein
MFYTYNYISNVTYEVLKEILKTFLVVSRLEMERITKFHILMKVNKLVLK